MLKPSYVIGGEYELDDLEAINSFRDGLVAVSSRARDIVP